MNTWYQIWGKTYQCQISNTGDLSVWDFLSSMTFPWLLMIFQSSMTFHDFSRKLYFSRFSRFSRPCGNPEWTHFTTIWKREWIYTAIVYVQDVIWNMHFSIQSEIWQSNRGSQWRSWRYVRCIITHGLCSYNARLFNDEVTAIVVSYWRRREFPNYARPYRCRICHDSEVKKINNVKSFIPLCCKGLPQYIVW